MTKLKQSIFYFCLLTVLIISGFLLNLIPETKSAGTIGSRTVNINDQFWSLSGTTLSPVADDTRTVSITDLNATTLTISSVSDGNITIQKADPSLIFDVATATDTDFWIGVQDDAGEDDDDKLYIGEGTSPGTGAVIGIDTSGNTRIGDGGTTNYANFSSAGVLTYNGSARPTRTIALDVNTAAVYADGAANAGSVIIDHDNTNNRNYTRWTSGTATQDIDLVFSFKLPSDFSAWAAANSLSVDVRNNDYAGNVMTASMYIAAGTVDAGISGASIVPTASNAWETKTDQPTDSYTAGDWVHLHIHLGNDEASNTVDIARVFFSYLATN